MKQLFATLLAPFAATLGVWGSNTLGGQHIPFTAGTILIPAIPILLSNLYHLYAKPPAPIVQ